MNTTSTRSGAVALAGAVVVGALASSASAQITLSDPVLRFEATNSSGSGFVEVAWEPGASSPDGSYFWFLTGAPLEIMDGPNVIGTITSASISAGNLPFKSQGVGFTVFAGDSETTFSVVSALSSFGIQTPGEARASGGITLTDSAGTASGADLSGAGPGGTIWSTLMNGVLAGTGTTFDNLLTGPFAVGDNASNAWTDESALAPIFTATGPITSITSLWGFTLSAGDQAAVTSGYWVVPAPAGLLVVVGGAIVVRRRR